jgi:hypothetical protein
MSRLPVLLLLALAPLQAAQGSGARYQTGTPALAAAFAAKETCSCLFVMERSAEACAEWTRVSPDVARAKADLAARTVTSRALLFWTAEARWLDERRGCVLVR